MNELDLAYIAGLVDGEAYIGIKKTQPYKCQGRQNPGYHARIGIRMADETGIKFIAETLGGWYYKEKPHAEKGLTLYCYQATDKSAAEILEKLAPYLKCKKSVAECVLQLRKLQSESKQHKTKITGSRNFPNQYGCVRTIVCKSFSDEYISMCDAFWQRCKDINAET